MKSIVGSLAVAMASCASLYSPSVVLCSHGLHSHGSVIEWMHLLFSPRIESYRSRLLERVCQYGASDAKTSWEESYQALYARSLLYKATAGHRWVTVPIAVKWPKTNGDYSAEDKHRLAVGRG